ncbi:hypothetical protein [Spirillospora albida]|nr:hypothetical protein [Spirillospora albida]
MIPALAIVGGSLLTLYLIWMLALLVGMAFTGSGYVGRHRAT